MKSKQLNVRLSNAAWNNLESICLASGLNKTAAVEIALAALSKGLTNAEYDLTHTLECAADYSK